MKYNIETQHKLLKEQCRKLNEEIKQLRENIKKLKRRIADSEQENKQLKSEMEPLRELNRRQFQGLAKFTQMELKLEKLQAENAFLRRNIDVPALEKLEAIRKIISDKCLWCRFYKRSEIDTNGFGWGKCSKTGRNIQDNSSICVDYLEIHQISRLKREVLDE
jgi:cell division protein FtsB